MKVYFRSSRGEMREIATFDNSLTDKDAVDEAMKVIRKFCEEREFEIYYTRIWNEMYDDSMMTKFDVGSHSEFFYIDRQIDITSLH